MSVGDEQARPRGLRYAFAGQPAVAALRYAAKLGLAAFVAAEDFGEVMIAGLVVFAASHLAILGLDEALVSLPRVRPALWRRLRRLHAASGVTAAALVAFGGWAFAGQPGYPRLGAMLVALAPMVVVANLSVLPANWLVRRRAYRAAFVVDLCGVGALLVTTVAAAAAGAGPWSLIAGWHANALVTWLAAEARVRAEGGPGREDAGAVGGEGAGARRDEDTTAAALRLGLPLMGAALLGFGTERIGTIGIGAFLGRSAVGVYELALQLPHFLVQYTQSLAERVFFPSLAEDLRHRGASTSLDEALRLVVTFVVPVTIVIAVLAEPIVALFGSETWGPAAPLLALLSLAAAARSMQTVAVTALKAAGRGRAVLLLGGLDLLLLLTAVAVGLPGGVERVVAALLLARGLGAAAALVVATPGRSVPAARAALLTFVVWAAAFLGLTTTDVGTPPLAVPGLALALWLAARAALDRAALARDWALVRARLGGVGTGGPP